MPTATSPAIFVRTATQEDREAVYRLRHRVYAQELGQYPMNAEERLTDALDAFNEYVVALVDGEVAGFVSITPAWGGRYSIDKYFAREEMPFPFDEGLFEIRILTVVPELRHGPLAVLLMRSAFEWVRNHGGKRIVIIGRREVADMYRKIGLRSLGRTVQSGAVTYELMTATMEEIDEACRPYADAEERTLARIARRARSRAAPPTCDHGGAFFQAIGDEFDRLDAKDAVVNADVLDAWFDPSPAVLAALQKDAGWMVRTSPPNGCEGLVRTIARARGVPEACIVPGAGSSALIFLALRAWLNATSRVLILDPMYGEYGHVLGNVVGAQVDRFPLSPEDGFRVDTQAFARAVCRGYDMVLMVNPNNPTGRHLPREELEPMLRGIPTETRVWIDETYSEYAGPGESVEKLAASGGNVVVCKSLSKVYGLSGVRAAYLCGPAGLMAGLRKLTPPWAVSLPAQIAAVAAMKDEGYYAGCWRRTHELRAALASDLRAQGLEVFEGVINSVLCRLTAGGPSAHEVVMRCRERGVFIRDCGTISPLLADRWVRVAVKDERTNGRIIEVLRQVLSG
jgi:histidinol-phosphate/aromatic aminotransferase/cobyric acid decarboxylase-like protein/N-acyl-L-homoserine lactone synthetase